MAVYVKVKGTTVNCDDIDSWKVVSLFGMFGRSGAYGINATFKGKKKKNDSWIRVGDYPSEQEANDAMDKILEGIIEAENDGGGIVKVS